MTEIAERPVSTGERIAEQTLIAFSEDSRQESIASFTPQDNPEINLDDYHPGTIFRVEYLDHQPDLKTGITAEKRPQYSWYVVGEREENGNSDEQRVFVYNVTLPRQSDNASRLPKSASAFAAAHNLIPVASIAVQDAKYVLEGHTLIKEKYNEIFPVTKVDVMALGIDLGKTQQVQVLNKRLN